MTVSYPRPVSPHLQIYKIQLTSFLSILHRGTGIALFVGILGVAFWLISVASGPQEMALFYELAGSWMGRVCAIGWIFSLYYHLSNGIRHLAWDWGWGFALKEVYASGWVVVAVSLTATAFTVWTLFWGRG